jgi:acetyl esterase/lipase
MTAATESEIPFHFGAGGKLFGLYHPAAAQAKPAVLLCPPLGQELIRSHRVYRQLAQAIAATGIPVLRFDYYGSGDSAGDSIEVEWQQCIDDTVAAAGELRIRSGCEQVLAFGARLGGNIAIASAARARFAELVLWDPVFDGAAHVARLDVMQNALQHDTKRFLKSRPASAVANQWLGFSVSESLRKNVAEQRIEAPAIPTLLLDSLTASNTQGIKTIALPTTPWDDPERLELAIISHELIQAVIGHLREVR